VQRRLHIAIALLALPSAVAVLKSYGSVRPITERSEIDGRPAPCVTVVLAAPFSFKYFLSTYTLPADRYMPAFEDDSGAYFAAPSKIVRSHIFAAPFLHEGGLYFRTDGSNRIDAYVVVRNQRFLYALAERADAR
jgi:hypothetical protein